MTPSVARRRKGKQPSSTKDTNPILNFNIKHIAPLTENQKDVFHSYFSEKNLLLHGYAGTGKSFVALYLLLKDLIDNLDSYKKIVIVKSIVPIRDIGFLPGSAKEKAEVYEQPYKSIFSELFNKNDAYNYFKSKDLVEFVPTSFIRGITLEDTLVLVDEIQNCDFEELSSVITRLGENCRIIFCGDFRQSDLRHRERDKKGDVIRFMDIIKNMEQDFTCIEFGIHDIVRSSLVKRFIIEANKTGDIK